MNTMTDIGISTVIVVLCAGLGLLCYHLGTRQRDSLKPRMMPWKFIGFGLFATGFMVFVHIVNLLGFSTGGGR